MTEREKMLAGEFYDPADPSLVKARARADRLLRRLDTEPDGQAGLLRKLLGQVGEGTEIRRGFACDYGVNILIGTRCYVNFHCVFLDCAAIDIGDRVQLAPAVQLYTATHPLGAAARATGLEQAWPIRVGDDCWIGGGAIILPGVTLGAGSVVAAGAVVTRDVPPGVLVAGSPARVVRSL